jgi:hypothetical protein
VEHFFAGFEKRALSEGLLYKAHRAAQAGVGKAVAAGNSALATKRVGQAERFGMAALKKRPKEHFGTHPGENGERVLAPWMKK